MIRLHLLPYLGEMFVGEIRPSDIRTWRADLTANGVGAPTIAKAYRITHAIFATAFDETRSSGVTPAA